MAEAKPIDEEEKKKEAKILGLPSNNQPDAYSKAIGEANPVKYIADGIAALSEPKAFGVDPSSPPKGVELNLSMPKGQDVQAGVSGAKWGGSSAPAPVVPGQQSAAQPNPVFQKVAEGTGQAAQPAAPAVGQAPATSVQPGSATAAAGQQPGTDTAATIRTNDAQLVTSPSGISSGVKFSGNQDATQYPVQPGTGVMTQKMPDGTFKTLAVSAGNYDPAKEAATAAAARADFEKQYAPELAAIRGQQQGIGGPVASLAPKEEMQTRPFMSAEEAKSADLRKANMDRDAIIRKYSFINSGGLLRAQREAGKALMQAELAALDSGYKMQRDQQTDAAAREKLGIESGIREREIAQRAQEAQARTSIDQRRLGIDASNASMNQQKAGIEMNAAKTRAEQEGRINALREQAAALNDQTDPGGKKRNELKSQIEILTGKDGDRMKIESNIDPMTGEKTPAFVFDPRTGKTYDTSGKEYKPKTAIPPGMKQIGTSNGVPVYEDEKGRRFTAGT